jgi:hypothetical protein
MRREGRLLTGGYREMRLKAVSGIMVALLLIGMFAVPAIITGVQGYASGISLSAFATRIPTIDGVINPDKWQDAATYSTTISGYEITLFVMNDFSNLYLAVRVSDLLKGTSDDDLWIIFDNDHDNILEIGDDRLRVYEGKEFPAEKGFSDWFRYSPTSRSTDVGHGGTLDGSGATDSTNGFREYELSHPLNSADDLHDFSLNAGDTVGFTLEIVDFDMDIGRGKCIDCPTSVRDGDFTGEPADIVIAEPPPLPPVGGKATPINIPMNKPETSTLWIWLTTIILSLVLAVVYVKKRKRDRE